MDDLVFASAQELAAAIRERRVSAVEVVDAHLAQIEKHNPQLNVIVTLDSERARARAEEADAALARGENWGPLHGVPFTAKDGFATAGVRTTSGFPPWADFVPQTDAPAVARLRAAGAILLGKTNLPELSMDVQTNNVIFGRTSNSWDLSRTCGGSTGGSAAIAAGLTPLELGSDLGGSVRIPAHCCGVYSLKPTELRLPAGGYHPSPQPPMPQAGGMAMAVFGPLARTVDDLTLAFQILAGPDALGWTIPPVPVGPLPERRLDQLRLAWTDDFGSVAVSADTRAALADLAEGLEQMGCQMQHCVPESFDFITAWEVWGELVAVGQEQNPNMASTFGANDTPIVRGVTNGLRLTVPAYQATLRKRSLLITALEAFFDQWDALICPVMATPAFPHCATHSPILVDDRPEDYWMASISYTTPFNVTGHPVVTLPVAQSSKGLPIGVQVVGRRWGEMPLLAVAKCISEVAGTFRRPPGY